MDFDQLLTAASEAMSAPETIVGRSARARASATGVAPEQILAEWAGVEAGAAPSPPAESPAPSEPAAPEPAAPPPPAAEVDVEVVAPLVEPSDAEPEPQPEPEPDEEPVEVLVGSAGIRTLQRFALPKWLTMSFVVVPLAALFYAATFATGPECGNGGALAIDPSTGVAENCDGSEFGSFGENYLALGAALYNVDASPACQACHSADGSGGAGPALASGAVTATFPSCADHIEWVTLGTIGWTAERGATYGANNKPAGGGGQMPGYVQTPDGGLMEEEIAAVVLFERVIFGGLGADAAEADCFPPPAN